MGKGTRGDSSMEGVSPTKSYGGVGRQETPQTNMPNEYRQSPVLSPPMPGIPGMERPHPMMPSQPMMGQQGQQLPNPAVPPPVQGVPGGQMGQPPDQSMEDLMRIILMSGGGGLFR